MWSSVACRQLSAELVLDSAAHLFLLHPIWNRDLSQAERVKFGISDNLVRFSFGVEDFEDLKADVLQALEAI